MFKENRALVMRCKELEIKLESRYNFVKKCYVWMNADEINLEKSDNNLNVKIG